MRVARVISAHDGGPSWTVLDGEAGVIEPVEAFLAFLTFAGRSPNTVRAYAHDLRDFFAYLRQGSLCWDELSAEQLAHFVVWLQMPAEGRAGAVAVLPAVESAVSSTTINRKLAAVSAFYEFHARHGVDVGDRLWTARHGRRLGTWKPLLAHIGSRPSRRRVISLKVARPAPSVLTAGQVDELLTACARLRDRFLLMLLRDTGLRIGEALGLRHEDLSPRRCEVAVRSRVNANGARVKTFERTLPVASTVLALYSDYLHEEYGALDSDYVFVSLWSAPIGNPLSYSAVHGVVRRLRAATGISFGPHTFRHTYATDLLRRGVAVEVVSKLLGHASVATTVDVYGHLSPNDTRDALVRAGVLPEMDAAP